MPERIPIDKRTKGPLGELEDWWTLVIQDDGAPHIEHEWSHHDPYGRRDPDSGTRIYPVDEFLAGDHDARARQNASTILAKQRER